MATYDRYRAKDHSLDVTVPAFRMRSRLPKGSEPSGTHTAHGSGPGYRVSAIAFLDLARSGTDLNGLVAWVDEHLVRPGRIMTRYPFPHLLIHEHGVGTLSYGEPRRDARPISFIAQSQAQDLAAAARRVVVDKLDRLLRPTPDDRFLQAAIYDGRVVRASRPDGSRGWRVMLTESHSLSDQVLSLLAADMLEDRNDYDHSLVVCEVCDSVRFWPERVSRRGCPAHPEGAIGLRSKRSVAGGRL